MDMDVNVAIATGASNEKIEAAWKQVDSVLAFWGDHYSQSGASSELSVLNHRSHDTVLIDKGLGGMIAEALEWNDSTGGMYDITELPLKEFWGLSETSTTVDADSTAMPTKAQVDSVLTHVGVKKVRVSAGHDTLFFSDPASEIDAGGFAKAYAFDQTAKLLDRLGYKNYLITSGDILGRGCKPDGKPWMIGIMHPRKSGTLMAAVPLQTRSIFTSGYYENFRMIGHRRVHHIFNPKTGYSATRNQSLTIASDNILQSKYLSTGLFGWAADSIVAYVEKRGLNCFVVDSAGKIWMSSGWKNVVKMEE